MKSASTSRTRRTIRLVGIAALIVGVAACSSDDDASDTPDATEGAEETADDGADTTDAPADPGDPAGAVNATIADFTFVPDPIAVVSGGTVTWTNDDGVPHTVTGTGDLEFDSGSIAAGDSFTLTVEEAGTFAYVCTIHGQMSGSLISS